MRWWTQDVHDSDICHPPSAGREHHRRRSRQLSGERHLAPSKRFFSFLCEEATDGSVCTPLNFEVEIKKWTTENTGDSPSGRGFSRSRKAYQYYVPVQCRYSNRRVRGAGLVVHVGLNLVVRQAEQGIHRGSGALRRGSRRRLFPARRRRLRTRPWLRR